MLKLLTIISLIALTGCASYNVQKYGNIDSKSKTITVPAGGKGLKGELKKLLSNDDWDLVVYGGPEVTEGSVGEKTKIKKYDTFNTRYSLHVASNQYDWCLNLQPAISYDVSIIDNKNGTEILTIDGRGCEGTVVEKFSQALQSVSKESK